MVTPRGVGPAAPLLPATLWGCSLRVVTLLGGQAWLRFEPHLTPSEAYLLSLGMSLVFSLPFFILLCPLT